MKNQFFTIAITQYPNGVQVTGQFRATEKFLSRYLGLILKEQPGLIPVFLDAAGQALIQQGEPRQMDKPAPLDKYIPTPEDLRFYDEIFG